MSLPHGESPAFASRTAPPKILSAFAALAVGVVSAGACPVQFTQHALGSYFEHCPDSLPSLSYLFLLSDPAGVNTGALDAVCRDAASETSQFIPCQPEAGVPGDGRVTIQMDWGGVGTQITGCPHPERAIHGAARLHVHTVSEDGQSILTSVSYQFDMATYVIEGAQPYAGSDFLPLACDEPGRRLLRIDATTSSQGNLAADLTLFAPRVSTDCDPGSAGELLGVCSGASPIANITPGRVYLQRGACAFLPVHDLRTPAWTFLSDSDAQGHASVSFPAPAADECVYLGATYRFDGQESPAIGGFVRIPSAGCVDEVCDGIDNDCDGATDENLGTVRCRTGRCALVIPACSGGVPQTCPGGRPVTPPCGPPPEVPPRPASPMPAGSSPDP